MKQNITINKEQSLYVFTDGKYTSCLGFDVVANRSVKLANEMKVKMNMVEYGSIEAYQEYERLTEIARKKHEATGWRSQSELIPEFIGREGQRVEVVTSWGEKQRYYIGKSTGFIPTHLEIKTNRSSGGIAVCGYPFKSVTFLNNHKNHK